MWKITADALYSDPHSSKKFIYVKKSQLGACRQKGADLKDFVKQWQARVAFMCMSQYKEIGIEWILSGFQVKQNH